MPWRVSLFGKLPIVETVYAGALNANDLSDAVRETLSVAVTHQITRLLGDCTQLDGGHTIVDLYSLANAIPGMGGDYNLKEAVLLPLNPNADEKVRFWETTCVNRGFMVKVFGDRDDAIAWLME